MLSHSFISYLFDLAAVAHCKTDVNMAESNRKCKTVNKFEILLSFVASIIGTYPGSRIFNNPDLSFNNINSSFLSAHNLK